MNEKERGDGMSDKHTKGPWVTEEIYSQIAIRHQYMGGGHTVAYVGTPGRMGGEEKRANARLIAAAPELLDACDAALGVLAEPGIMDIDKWKVWQKRTVAQLHAVIKKAKGE